MSSIDIVTFHYSLARGLEAHPNETRPHGEYLEMISMMTRSAKLFHRSIHPVLLTSSDTDLRGLSRNIQVIHSQIDPEKLMLSRTKAQLRFLQQSSFRAPIVFIDSDMLFNSSLAPLFERDFDIAVTVRTRCSVPINGGLMIANNKRPDVVRAFFQKFTDLYESQFADQAEWYGDQNALVSLLGLTPFATDYPMTTDFEGCRILLLPCETYNYSPDNTPEPIEAPLADKILLHFKGQRKHLMTEYWRRHLADKQGSLLRQTLLRLRNLIPRTFRAAEAGISQRDR